jgi:hypothetical protein
MKRVNRSIIPGITLGLGLAISVTLWATSIACNDCTTNYSYLQAGVAYLWANKSGPELMGQGADNQVTVYGPGGVYYATVKLGYQPSPVSINAGAVGVSVPDLQNLLADADIYDDTGWQIDSAVDYMGPAELDILAVQKGYTLSNSIEAKSVDAVELYNDIVTLTTLMTTFYGAYDSIMYDNSDFNHNPYIDFFFVVFTGSTLEKNGYPRSVIFECVQSCE